MTHKFDPKNKEKLESKSRKKILPAYEILKSLGLKEGEIFADIGAGTGYFTIEAAKIIGDTGYIYALDISEDMLSEVDRKAQDKGIDNITLIKTDEYNFNMESDTVDFAFLANVAHEVEDKSRFLREVYRVLKNEGRVGIVDFEKKVTQEGPPLDHRLDKNDLIDILNKEGFVLTKDEGYSDVFYGVLAKKK